jgi:dihydropteroate synthase
MKPAVARAALRAGASIVNDVAANRGDDEMGRLVAETGAGYVAMHMQGTPQTMQHRPAYRDVVVEVGEFFVERMARLRTLGVSLEQIVLDVGLGFGKTTAHNLQLLAALNRFTTWNRPVLLGASRKSFIRQVAVETGMNEALPGSVACACWGVAAGASIIRTHDVAATRQAVRLTEAIVAQRK